MSPERWKRVEPIFQAALDRRFEERAAFLAEACAGDEDLRREVESLLRADEGAADFIEAPALAEPTADSGEEPDDTSQTVEAGTRLGPYQVLALLAAGGMGEVYRARDTRLGREVAVKVLPRAWHADAGRLRRFHEEARAAGALSHPNILAVYDVGTAGPLPFVVCELLEGETLRARLTRDVALAAEEAADIARQMAAGLAAAHEKGILHRDLKPANLFLTKDGRVKILDFGLAKRLAWQGAAAAEDSTAATQPGVVLGTAGYMSPEQARSEPTDPRTDVFSFGSVLFEMLTGRRAFHGRTPADTMAAVLDGEPEFSSMPAEVPTWLRDVARRCLEKEPQRRFASARELLAALSEGGSGTIRASPAAPVPGLSVAVLPFLDLEGGGGQEHLCDGLAEELIHALAGVPGLRVAARTSSFQFKGRAEEVRRIGERLGVARIVDGSVRRVGSRLRIIVQLVDARDGYHVWSERFDRELGDVFALQDEIAARVVEALKLRVAAPASVRGRPRDAEGYELYLKGRYFWNKRYQGELKKAIAAFEGAILRDPDHAAAHAGLADALSVVGYYGLAPERETFGRARRSAQRALAIDARSPEAHVALALVQDWFDWDLAAAESSLRRALDLSPDDVTAHLYLGHVLGLQGRGGEAVSAARAGAQRDPLSPLAHTLVATALYLAGEDAEAVRAVERALELDARYPPALLYATLAESRRGRHARAVAAAREAVAASESMPFFESVLGWALARAGDAEGARAALARLEDRGRREYVPAICRARMASSLGDHERALEGLEEAVAHRNTWVVNLGADPWPELESHPRWSELLARAGIARDAGGARTRAAPSAGAAPTARSLSVAVLPFRDLSPLGDDRHLGLGLADAVITELAGAGSLLVRPTSAVLRYHQAEPDPREAGRALGVDSIVEGSVQRSGDHVRVTVQLTAVQDGRPLWGTKVDVSWTDLFAVQDEVSTRIAEALRVELAPRRGRRTARAPRPGAYEMYLKGKLALWRESLADCIAAVDWFEKARDADPEFALAWAGLADAYVRIGFGFQPKGDWYARGQAMCDRALALDPELPEARYVRARLVWNPRNGFDHAGAMRELLAALQGRPNLDEAYVRLGVVLFHVGLLDEAERALERALALSPEHEIARGNVAACRLHRGRFAEAREIADAAAARNGSYWNLYLAAHARLRLGDVEGAATVADRMISLGEAGVPHVHAVHGLLAARRGEAGLARRKAEQAAASKSAFGHYHHDQYDIACIHALLGDAPEALRWLRDVVAGGYACHPFFAIDPMLEGLRPDPAFAAFLDGVRSEDDRHASLYARLVREYSTGSRE